MVVASEANQAAKQCWEEERCERSAGRAVVNELCTRVVDEEVCLGLGWGLDGDMTPVGHWKNKNKKEVQPTCPRHTNKHHQTTHTKHQTPHQEQQSPHNINTTPTTPHHHHIYHQLLYLALEADEDERSEACAASMCCDQVAEEGLQTCVLQEVALFAVEEERCVNAASTACVGGLVEEVLKGELLAVAEEAVEEERCIDEVRRGQRSR
jgi:hypothetical protein